MTNRFTEYGSVERALRGPRPTAAGAVVGDGRHRDVRRVEGGVHPARGHSEAEVTGEVADQVHTERARPVGAGPHGARAVLGQRREVGQQRQRGLALGQAVGPHPAHQVVTTGPADRAEGTLEIGTLLDHLVGVARDAGRAVGVLGPQQFDEARDLTSDERVGRSVLARELRPVPTPQCRCLGDAGHRRRVHGRLPAVRVELGGGTMEQVAQPGDLAHEADGLLAVEGEPPGPLGVEAVQVDQRRRLDGHLVQRGRRDPQARIGDGPARRCRQVAPEPVDGPVVGRGDDVVESAAPPPEGVDPRRGERERSRQHAAPRQPGRVVDVHGAGRGTQVVGGREQLVQRAVRHDRVGEHQERPVVDQSALGGSVQQPGQGGPTRRGLTQAEDQVDEAQRTDLQRLRSEPVTTRCGPPVAVHRDHRRVRVVSLDRGAEHVEPRAPPGRGDDEDLHRHSLSVPGTCPGPPP